MVACLKLRYDTLEKIFQNCIQLQNDSCAKRKKKCQQKVYDL